MDFATRAYNQTFPFDPIVRSLLDTDFYKLLMQQFIWEHYPNERVTWRVTNRTSRVKLGREVAVDDLRQQLDHVRTLRFTPSEIIHLRGQSFYGQTGIFKPAYLETLRAFALPDYELSRTEDGQIELVFTFIASHLVLKERPSAGEWLGSILVIGGVVLILIGR